MSDLFLQYPQSGGGGSSTGSSTGVPYAVGVLDGAPANDQGGFIGSFSFYQQSATSTSPGLISSAAQVFSGVKTFLSSPLITTLKPGPTRSVGSSLSTGSISLTTEVSGILPAANIPPLSGLTGSVSLTAQVSGILPAGNLPPLSGITGSVSLTAQVSGLLPLANMNLSMGALDGAAASPNAATLGTNSLYLQSATNANPGIISSANQNFSGIKSFERIGLNNVSGSSTLWITTSSASLGDPSLTIRAIPSQTGDLLQIFDSSNAPQVIFDSGGNFKFFHNTLNTSRFDVRPSINTSAINSGSANNSAVRYTAFFSQNGVQATGVGGGIALGGPNNVGTNTTYGCVWVTKDNGVAGDVSASMHFATKNNSTGNFQRAIDIDAGGNTTFAGTIAITGSVASKVTIGMPNSNTPYTLTLPVSQGSTSWVLQNDGTGILSWASVVTNPMTTTGDIIVGSGTGVAARLGVGPAGSVLMSDTTASNSVSWQSPTVLGNRIVNSGLDYWQAAGSGAFVSGTSGPGLLYTTADQFWLSNATINSLTLQVDQILPQVLGSRFGARIVVASNVAGTVGFSANNTPWVAGQMLSSAASRDLFGQRASASIQLKATNYETAANLAFVTNTIEAVTGYTVVASATVTITSASFTNVTLNNFLVGTAHGITGVVGIKFSAQTVSSGALSSTVSPGSGLFFEQPVLNAGPVAVPFSRQYSDPIGELDACQYFFERIGNGPTGIPGEPLGVGTFISTTVANFYTPFKATKRTTSTVSYTVPATFQARTSVNNYGGSAVSLAFNGMQGLMTSLTIGTAQTANNSCYICASGNGYLFADARMG